jgi:hypothetical protein
MANAQSCYYFIIIGNKKKRRLTDSSNVWPDYYRYRYGNFNSCIPPDSEFERKHVFVTILYAVPVKGNCRISEPDVRFKLSCSTVVFNCKT